MNNLKAHYQKTIAKELQKSFAFSSIMQVPRLEKIVINMGVGDAIRDSKFLESALNELHLISGQKPVATKAKNAISTYKLRAGQLIGCKVTLRAERMWAFLEKLIYVALPRVRDFRGLSLKSFDGRGNYTIGIKEQIIFPEIVYDDIKRIRGFDVTLVTSTNKDSEALALLRALNLPLVKG
ncbi:50S ribosomal protein L5 [Mycoplasmoides pneumoniae]|uniref:50S ribosomal protein L5 n=1 Tax=Mycoplasmoides pneumoniae TaxID=2104 RepID=UPI003D08BBD4